MKLRSIAQSLKDRRANAADKQWQWWEDLDHPMSSRERGFSGIDMSPSLPTYDPNLPTQFRTV